MIKAMQEAIREAGYKTNTRKMKIQRHYHQQKMLGIVVNHHPNIPRLDYRRYRAIIHNCLQHGFELEALRFGWDPPETFIDHLRGKLSYFHSVNAQKADKLRLVLDSAVAKHGSSVGAEAWYEAAETDVT